MKKEWIPLCALLLVSLAGCAKTRFVQASTVTDLNAHPHGATVTSHGVYNEQQWTGPAGVRKVSLER
jgi:hypothetical protein